MTIRSSHAPTAAVEPIDYYDPEAVLFFDPGWEPLPDVALEPTLNDRIAARYGLKPPPPFFTFEEAHPGAAERYARDMAEEDHRRALFINELKGAPASTSATPANDWAQPSTEPKPKAPRAPRVRPPYHPTLPPDEAADARAHRLARSWGLAPRGTR